MAQVFFSSLKNEGKQYKSEEPPPEKGPKWGKVYKSVENPHSWHFFPGGGGNATFMDKTILWTSGPCQHITLRSQTRSF